MFPCCRFPSTPHPALLHETAANRRHEGRPRILPRQIPSCQAGELSSKRERRVSQIHNGALGGAISPRGREGRGKTAASPLIRRVPRPCPRPPIHQFSFAIEVED